MHPSALLIGALLGAVVTTASHAAEVFANRTLRVGTILVAGDIGVRDPNAASAMEDWVGLEVRRAVYAGHNLLPGDVGPPTLVRRNDIVTMTFRSGALGLRTEGRALGAGGQGEAVEVMNLDSRMTVRAVITGTRQVEVRR